MNNNTKNFAQTKQDTSPVKSIPKIDPKSLNLETIVKNGEARKYLSLLAKNMLDDHREFNLYSVNLFNKTNTIMNQEVTTFLKNITEFKRKTDSILSDQSERMRKMELLKSMRERFMSNNGNSGNN